MKKKILQWSIYLALGAWGFYSFLVLAGDEDPAHPMILSKFCTIKIIALSSLALCGKTAQICNRRGLLPEFKDPEE